MSNKINEEWGLKDILIAIRRCLTKEIDAYYISRLQAEFKHGLAKLDVLKKEQLKKSDINE